MNKPQIKALVADIIEFPYAVLKVLSLLVLDILNFVVDIVCVVIFFVAVRSFLDGYVGTAFIQYQVSTVVVVISMGLTLARGKLLRALN